MSETLFTPTDVASVTAVVEDGADLGLLSKAGKLWTAKPVGADDYTAVTYKSRKLAVAALRAAALVPAPLPVVVAMSAEDATAALEGLLGADVEAEVEGPDAGEPDNDSAPEVKATKNPRTYCPLCDRKVPAKSDGTVGSHKGFKRTLDGAPARRCDGTPEGLKPFDVAVITVQVDPAALDAALTAMLEQAQVLAPEATVEYAEPEAPAEVEVEVARELVSLVKVA